ncbi:hypothetical protein YPPY103_4871, partial [Yersinia pestis PY-103]
MAAFIA